MFDHTQYVPVIRWKAGEQWALSNLRPDIRRRVTPLFELLPQNFVAKKLTKAHGVEGRMSEIASEVVKSWGRTPFFMDTIYVDNILSHPSRPHPLRLLGNGARLLALKGIPVTGINRTDAQKNAAQTVSAELGQGIAFRVFPHEINASLGAELGKLLSEFSVTPSGVHLILDQQLLNGSTYSVSGLLGLIPDLGMWQSVTLLGGAFPPDLSKIEKNTQEELSRTEWTRWRPCVEAAYEGVRTPTFGDYTVQHPLYREPPARFNVSASIRYTSDDYWVIMRGEGVQNDDGPGYDGYLGNAMLLVERDEFCGAPFSAGDECIQLKSMQSEKSGNAKTWIQAAINHHITFVVRQIATLTGS